MFKASRANGLFLDLESPEKLGMGRTSRGWRSWPSEPLPQFMGSAILLEPPREAGRRLYEVKHGFNAAGVPTIVVIMQPDEPGWLAIRDRLLRATRLLGTIEP
jgi:hypothetical protein